MYMYMVKKLRSIIAKIYMYNLFGAYYCFDITSCLVAPKGGGGRGSGGGKEDKRFKGKESTCYKKPLTLNHAH